MVKENCFAGIKADGRKRMSKKKKIKTPMCENCEECVYVGDGGHFCSEHHEIVLEDWCPTDKYLCCGVKDFID